MLDASVVQIIAYIATGAGIGTGLAVPILKHLGRNWLKQREDFERDTAETLRALSTAIASNKDTLSATIAANREEAADARQVLRNHFDHEDGILRERNHNLAGSVGVLTNRVEVLSNEIKAAIAANKETLEWCQDKYEKMGGEIHSIAVGVAKITAEVAAMTKP